MFIFFAKNRNTVHDKEIQKTKQNEKMFSLISKDANLSQVLEINIVMNKTPQLLPS